MDDVRVHYNSSKPATVQALAYTQGTDIHVAPGQEKHLPHEAWHVAQQMAGRVSPTTNINGMPVNDNAELEHEANVMGAKALQMKSDESKTVQRATIWNGVVQRVNPEDYYYHICSFEKNRFGNLPIITTLDPKHVLKSKPGEGNMRLERGDDLGPGFYMGDFDFLKYYYGLNFTDSNVRIYYIEKKLIDETMGKENITDFTEKTAPKIGGYTKDVDDWFQIAMQLGFRYVNEKDTNNHQRPLDLLAEENKDDEEENMRKFTNCVEKIYGKNETANKIIKFFENAQNKAIWKGYINDIDRFNINFDDIKDFLTKKGIEDKDANECVKELAEKYSGDFTRKTFKEFSDESANKIEKITSNLSSFNIQDYYDFLNRELHRTYHYLNWGEENKIEPIQIAIRKDVDINGEGLLGEIVKNKIEIDKIEIAKVTKPKTDGDSKTEESTQGDTNSEILEGPKTETLEDVLTIALTEEKIKKLQKEIM